MIRSGLSRVLRHQRILWWMFFVNLALAFLASIPTRSGVGAVTNRSLASDKLAQGFDVFAFLELIGKPDVPIGSLATAAMLAAFVFLVYTLFISGGVIEVYREDRKLSRAEFFEYSGAFFWRMVRLALLSLVLFGLLGFAFSVVNSWSDRLSSDAAKAKAGFYVLLGFGFAIALVMLWVRAWFDFAQVHAVAQNERGMLRTSLRSAKVAIRNSPRFAFSYLAIAVTAWLFTVFFLWLWMKVPHERLGLAFLMLQLTVLAQIAARLWQKAAITVWYERHASDFEYRAAVPAYAASPLIEPQPQPAIVNPGIEHTGSNPS